MSAAPPVAREPEGSRKIRQIGRTVIRASLLIMFMTLVGLVQMYPPMGEIGNFTYQSAFVLIPMCVWGVATGMGLTRAWRWSRFSMLMFGGLLTFATAVPALGFLLMSREGLGWWEAAGLRALGLPLLIAPALVVRWHWYFVGDEARAYFRGIRRAPTASA